MSSMQTKLAVVTGASRGIGRAIIRPACWTVMACSPILRIDSRRHHERINWCCRCVRWLPHRHAGCARRRNSDVSHCSGDRRCCRAVRLANGQVTVYVACWREAAGRIMIDLECAVVLGEERLAIDGV